MRYKCKGYVSVIAVRPGLMRKNIISLPEYFLPYCAFQKHANYEIQKPIDDYVFRCRQSDVADLLEKKTLLQRVQKVMYVICHWWISIRFGSFCVSRFVACDRNYD